MKDILIKIVLIALLILCVSDNISKRKEIGSLKESIVSFNKAQDKSVKTITKIREVIKNVPTDCDCYNQLLPDDVIAILHKQ